MERLNFAVLRKQEVRAPSDFSFARRVSSSSLQRASAARRKAAPAPWESVWKHLGRWFSQKREWGGGGGIVEGEDAGRTGRLKQETENSTPSQAPLEVGFCQLLPARGLQLPPGLRGDVGALVHVQLLAGRRIGGMGCAARLALSRPPIEELVLLKKPSESLKRLNFCRESFEKKGSGVMSLNQKTSCSACVLELTAAGQCCEEKGGPRRALGVCLEAPWPVVPTEEGVGGGDCGGRGCGKKPKTPPPPEAPREVGCPQLLPARGLQLPPGLRGDLGAERHVQLLAPARGCPRRCIGGGMGRMYADLGGGSLLGKKAGSKMDII